jgi:hypothetical protein
LFIFTLLFVSPLMSIFGHWELIIDIINRGQTNYHACHVLELHHQRLTLDHDHRLLT